MFRGDTLLVAFQVVRDLATGALSTVPASGELPPGSSPIDATGWGAWFTLKRYPSDPDSKAVAQATTHSGAGLVWTSPTLGKGLATVPPIATRGFPDGEVRLVYDVQVIDTGGRVSTVETGTIAVSPDITGAIAGPP